MKYVYKNPKEVKGDTVSMVEVEVMKETVAAFLLGWNGLEIWLPKSQTVSIGIDDYGVYIAIISEWIAEQKGIPWDKSTGIAKLTDIDANPF